MSDLETPFHNTSQRVPPLFWSWVVLALVYFATAKASLALAIIQKNASPVWIPTGLSLAALLLFGRRLWPGVFIGAFFANLATQGSFVTSLAIAAGNTLETIVGASLVQRYAQGLETFSTPRLILRYLLFATLLSTLISGTIGTTSLSLAGYSNWSNYKGVWLTWWLGNVTSNLIVAPFLLAWLSSSLRISRARLLKWALLVIVNLLVCLLIYTKWGNSRGYPLRFLLFPVLIAAGLRFGLRGTTLVALFSSAFASLMTLIGWGPFVSFGMNETFLLHQAFMSALAMTGFFLTAVVGQHHKARKEVQAASDRLKLALEAGKMDAWEWSLSTNTVNWYLTLDSIHGLSRELADTFEKVLNNVYPADRPGIDAALRRTQQTGEDCHFEYRVLLENNDLRWLEGRGHLFRDDAGKPTKIAGVCIDITNRKLAEQVLAHQKEILALNNQDLKKFAFASSHNLLEPVRVITNYCDLLSERLQTLPDPSALRFTDRVKASAMRMKQLIDGLLIYGEVNDDSAPKNEVDLNLVVHDVLKNLETIIKETQTQVICEELPSVRGSAEQFCELFKNLITNAIKFRGPSPARIVISAVSDFQQWIFSVQDNGIGIAPQYREKIFTMFERLHTAKIPGAGIGLAICKRVVASHGGRIWAEPNHGTGSTFCFTLPIHNSEPKTHLLEATTDAKSQL